MKPYWRWLMDIGRSADTFLEYIVPFPPFSVLSQTRKSVCWRFNIRKQKGWHPYQVSERKEVNHVPNAIEITARGYATPPIPMYLELKEDYRTVSFNCVGRVNTEINLR
jgi:hypothetical protein